MSSAAVSKKTEGQQSTRDFQALVDSIRDYAIITLDLQGRVISWNSGAREIKGYEASEILGQSFTRFYTAADVAAEKPKHLLETAAREGRVEDEGWRVKKDGSRFWADVVISPVRDEAGKVTGFIKVTRDLTQRKKAEEQLRESDERLRLLVDGAVDYAIFMLDTAGRVLTWNTGAQRIKGYRAEEIIGKHSSTFYPPEDIAVGKPGRELQVAVATGRVEDEGWRIRKNGERFWANVVITALYDAQSRLRGFAKVTRDLTERRRAEELLRQSEHRTGLLVESIKDYAIFMLDPQGNVVSWNLGAERLKGYRANEIIGKHLSLFYTPEDRARGKPAQMLAAATTAGRVEDEGWRVRKDGSRFWADVVITPIRDQANQLLGFAKVTRDLTQHRQTERAMMERSAELTAANRELESFSYSVSHDLRAPLRGIDGFSKALLREFGDQLPREGQQYLERIRRAAGRMSVLIDDLLNLSRIARDEIKRQPVDLTRLAEDVITDLRRLDPERKVNVVVAPGMTTRADMRLIQAVLENLIGNAWKFTSKTPDARIEIGMKGRDGSSEFFVKDNGVGFSMDYADKLFAPFQRLHTEQEFEGTGIGLATVYRIISRHGGRVRAEAKPGEGATFWFTMGAES